MQFPPFHAVRLPQSFHAPPHDIAFSSKRPEVEIREIYFIGRKDIEMGPELPGLSFGGNLIHGRSL